ncbi:MAG: MFS transporter, partial [Actinomycetota bacterium]|nr:MFS transporter [Actinomycetota bacterium]
ALGLAVLVSLAASRTNSLLGSGDVSLVALNGGYHAAFLVGAAFALAAGLLGAALLRTTAATARAEAEPAPASELA